MLCGLTGEIQDRGSRLAVSRKMDKGEQLVLTHRLQQEGSRTGAQETKGLHLLHTLKEERQCRSDMGILREVNSNID